MPPFSSQPTCQLSSPATSQLEDDDSPRTWCISGALCLPRKVVTKCLEAIDYVDSPDNPGVMCEDTLQATVERFDTVFYGVRSAGQEEARDDQLQATLEILRRHTKRRRGEAVVSKGFIEWEHTSMVYDLFTLQLNVFERIYFTIDSAAYPGRQDKTPWLARLCSVFLVAMIFLSILSWVFSTLPYEPIRVIPDGCVGTGVGECAPEASAIFVVAEAFCVYVFTLEYVAKLLTVHSVRFAMSDEQLLERVIGGGAVETLQAAKILYADAPTMTWYKSMVTKRKSPEKLDGRAWRTVKHVFSFPSLVDLFSILPFWMEAFKEKKGEGGAITLIRILRLTRIFRVFKLGKYNEVFNLFSSVISQSTPALSLLLVFVLLDCCLFGALMWFAEQGTWFPEDHARLQELEIQGRGAYLRRGFHAHDEWQETPFVSIIHSFWYVIVTITTVGYGDMFPTTELGKLVGCVTMLTGLIILAMPVGVVGANFSNEYFKVQAEKQQKEKQRRQAELRSQIEEEQDSALSSKSEKGDELGTEAQRLYQARQQILVHAEGLDVVWHEYLPELRYAPLSAGLRRMVRVLLDLNRGDFEPEQEGKPMVKMSQLVDLDRLTMQVLAAISASVSVEDEMDSASFGLKEARQLRRTWLEFTSLCWEYVEDLCSVEREGAPPEFSRMQSHLKRKSSVQGGDFDLAALQAAAEMDAGAAEDAETAEEEDGEETLRS